MHRQTRNRTSSARFGQPLLQGVIGAVRDVPNNLGRGVIWWAPEWIPTKWTPEKGMGNWSPKTLFDDEGNALPALDAFKIEKNK